MTEGQWFEFAKSIGVPAAMLVAIAWGLWRWLRPHLDQKIRDDRDQRLRLTVAFESLADQAKEQTRLLQRIWDRDIGR